MANVPKSTVAIIPNQGLAETAKSRRRAEGSTGKKAHGTSSPGNFAELMKKIKARAEGFQPGKARPEKAFFEGFRLEKAGTEQANSEEAQLEQAQLEKAQLKKNNTRESKGLIPQGMGTAKNIKVFPSKLQIEDEVSKKTVELTDGTMNKGEESQELDPKTEEIQSFIGHSPQKTAESTSLLPDVPVKSVETDLKKHRAASGKPASTLKGRSESPLDTPQIVEKGKISKAGRVIVDDRRPDSSDLGFLREKGGLNEIRKTSPVKGARSEPVVLRTESTMETGGGTRFAIAETDIELPGISKEGPRSAAAELTRRLDAQAGNEIVRQVKVILNRADAGEIRINLRPENLGRVKVRIRLEENRLTGRIFVESAAARDAFRASLDGLQTRLVQSGFNTADLELSWDEHEGGGFAQFGQQSNHNPSRSDEALREFESMAGTSVIDGEASPYGHVNLVI